MALGGLQNEADLQRWLNEQPQQPNVLTPQAVSGLSGLLALLGIKEARFGVATLTFGGGVSFAFATIPHGLSGVPTIAPLTARQASNGTAIVANHTADPNATNLSVRGETSDGSNPVNGTTTKIGWLAIR